MTTVSISAPDAVVDSPRGEGWSTGRPTAALVVDDEPGNREFLRFALSNQCTYVEAAGSMASADQLLERCNFDILVVDVRLPDGSGVDWIIRRRAAGDLTPVVFLSARSTDAEQVAGQLAGNPELVSKPFSLDHLMGAVARALEHRPAPEPTARPSPAVSAPAVEEGLEGVVAQSDAMRTLLALIRRVAGRGSTVLLEGESGTGKEVAARCLHHFSGRRGAFVPVNCGAIAAELLESELFGHIKGAFTGATQHRDGLFTYANGGTLLLDEICEMPFPMQARLLRVLEERTIRPVGSEKEHPVDVRIVAATNKVMSEEVAKGHFREDLYYRLNILALRLPPLRERTADIPYLVTRFSENLSRELMLPQPVLDDRDVKRLQAHCWPGNVRELKNLVERAMLLGMSPAECLEGSGHAPLVLSEGDSGYPADMPLDEVERLHVLKALRSTEGNKSEAARRLGVSRKTLERKVKAWGAP